MKQLIFILSLSLLTACTTITPPSSTIPAAAATTFSDPFAYCAAVGTIDAPDTRYTGEAVPEGVAQSLQAALKTDMPVDVLSNGTSWRCMDGQVYGCFVGANLPCTDKANIDKTPAQALIDFCQDAANTNAEAIPAAVTGHNTVYSWRCTDGQPEAVDQVFQVDAQGFIADIWYPLTEATTAAADTYTDPFAYCAAVGTVDAPDTRYTGAAVPEGVTAGLQTALQTDMPLDVLSNGTSWRCMDGQVYGCFVGANLPCNEKANTDTTPAQALLDFCQEAANTNAEAIPAVVTGRNTVYAWRCVDGKPEAGDQVFQVDAAGFIADIWYPLTAASDIAPTATMTSTMIGMANPASVNCEAQGGTLTIEQRGDGGEFGVCTFEDNLQCEEWALMNGACPVGGIKVTGYLTPAARYCAITGGEYADNGTTSAENEQGICTAKSGTTCPAADLYNGQCTLQ